LGPFKNEEGETLEWTEKQKQWFLRRDEGICQFVDFSTGRARNCFRKLDLHVHFIIPPRFGLKKGLTEQELINPLNGIIICSFHHLKFIHPDIGILARRWYRFDQNSYKIILNWHEILAQNQVPYWNTTWDEVLKLIAKFRTRKYLKNHPQDPFPQ
jgi:hypothetical protein